MIKLKLEQYMTMNKMVKDGIEFTVEPEAPIVTPPFANFLMRSVTRPTANFNMMLFT